MTIDGNGVITFEAADIAALTLERKTALAALATAASTTSEGQLSAQLENLMQKILSNYRNTSLSQIADNARALVGADRASQVTGLTTLSSEVSALQTATS